MILKVFRESTASLPTGRIRRLFKHLFLTEGNRNWRATVNLVFTLDRKIRALNRQFRKLDRPTDVLSFNLDNPTAKDGIFGEVYISVPTACRQARQYHLSLDEELIRLALHGFLHLCGYDHQRKQDEKRMKARETYYLEALLGGKG